MIEDEFTFIDIAAGRGEVQRFDVYRAAGGAPLGHVAELQGGVWAAVDPDTRDQVRRRSRLSATAGLWGAR